MLGFWPIGQYALGQPGGATIVAETITLSAYGCLCVTPKVYIGPTPGPTSNVVRTGPGATENLVI